MSKKFLYFWKNEINIGDYASLYVVKKLSSDEITYKNPFIKTYNIIYNFFKWLVGKKNHTTQYVKDFIFPWNNVIWAIGSILDFAPKNAIVWGSGFREYNSKTKANKILAVRGFLSKKLLNISSNNRIEIGDPAILLPIVYPREVNGTKKIAIIPHYKEVENFKNFNTNQYDIIDPRTSDIEEFINKIVQYEYVLSSSLHGIIISHSYGVKALWIKYGNVGSSDFKYHDYFSSVNISNYPELNALKAIELPVAEIENLFKIYTKQSFPQCELSEIQKKLIKCAPFNLKSEYI